MMETHQNFQKRAARPSAGRKQKGPKEFAFVEADSTGRTPADRRQLIRSHVMRGKNTAKRAPRLREPEAAREEPPCSNEKPDEDGSRRRFTFWPNACQSPLKSPSDLALFIVADEVDETSRCFIRQFFVDIKENMYPIEWCVGQHASNLCWFYWACTDTVYLHSLLFAVSAFHDILGGANIRSLTPAARDELTSYFSPRTLHHLRRAMQLLQERLKDNSRQLEDATTAVVVTLALMADAVGDTNACRTHVSGLKEMMRLRGGMKSLESNREVQLKLCRVDLAWSIRRGCKPIFFDGDVSWSSCFDKTMRGQLPPGMSPQQDPLFDYLQTLDIKLHNVYADMRDFASAVNTITGNRKTKFQLETFLDIIMSIQSRLLLLEYSLESQPLEEALHAGLLAFQTTVFLLVPGLKLSRDFLAGRLRLAVDALDASTPALRDLKLWMLLTGCVAMMDLTDPWLMDAVASLTVDEEWPQVRERMKSIMWIDAIHDGPGKRVFDAARPPWGPSARSTG